MLLLLGIVLAAWLPAPAPQRTTAPTLDVLVAEAQQAEAKRDCRAAADAYGRAVSLSSDSAELWSNLGLTRYECHEYPEAEKALRRAVGLKPELFAPNLFLGLDLLELKRPKEALAYLSDARKLNPRDVPTMVALGRTFYSLREPAQSRDWFHRAVEAAPHNGDAWYGLGLAHLALAESSSGKLMTGFASSPYAAKLIADTLAQQGRLTEAIQAYSNLLASSKELPLCARSNYASILLQHGDREKAQEQFERDRDTCPAAQDLQNPAEVPSSPKDVSASPDSLSGHAALEQFANRTFFSGNIRAAARAADRLQRQYSKNAAGWYWGARANQALGVAALGHAGEVEPDSLRMHALLGDAYQERRLFQEAEEEYSKMLALRPDSLAALTGLAGAHLQEGHLDDARASADKALAQAPQDGDVNLLMSEVLVAQHRYAEAEPYLQRSLNARQDLLPRAHALLGRVYARTGHRDEAIRELKQGLSSDEDGSVYYQLARLYQSSGDPSAAAAAFEQSNRIRRKQEERSPGLVAPAAEREDSPDK